MKPAVLTTLTCLLALTTHVHAVTLMRGQPAIKQFVPDLDVYPQNFDLAVDKRSGVYVANADGVLVFDGRDWQQVETSNGDIVRSLKYNGDDRVYVGGYGEFGYIEPDATGRFIYTNLSELFADVQGGEPFADIWRIEVTPDAVYFASLDRLFRYDPADSSTGMWRVERSFGPIVWFQGRVLAQFRGHGLMEYDAGDWRLVEGPDQMSTILLESMVSIDDEELILVSSESNWYRYDGQRFDEIEDSDKIPFKGSVTGALALTDRTLALTTQFSKVLLYDLETQHTDIVEAGSGFLSGIVQAPSGEILVADNLGFYAVPWPAHWKALDARQGLVGGVNRYFVANGKNYVLTSSGAFSAEVGATRFERLAWTDYEAWDLLPLEDGSLMFADSYEIKTIAPNGNIKIIDPDTTARVFVQSRFDPDIVYVGTEYGVQVLKRDDDNWVTLTKPDTSDNLRITDIIETGPRTLWLGSERGGISQLSFPDVDTWLPKVTVMTPDQGLLYGSISDGAYLRKIDDEIFASTSAGFFRWSGERFVADDVDGLSKLVTPNQATIFASDDAQRWAFQFNRVYRYDGSWHEEDVGALKSGAIQSISFVDGRVFVGSQGSILTYNALREHNTATYAPLRLASASVYQTTGSELEIRSLPLDRLSIASGDDRLNLRFALPDFSADKPVLYRTRLSPAELNFSPWSEGNEQTFARLSPGKYEFEVEAKNGAGHISRLSEPIVVTPRWFETGIARVVGLLLLFLLIYSISMLLSRRRSRLLALERDRLEEMVEERTRALKSANQQLDKMAHLDGLTQIPNRRRLETYLEDVRLQCVERGRIMAIAIIDVDHFKRFNDSFGHQAGDTLLVELATLLSRNLRRAEDLVARYGGEEFLVVLPGAEHETAHRVVEDMRVKVEQSGLNITISVGLHVNLPSEKTEISTMIETADAALYRAKDEGRNRVVVG